MYFFESWKSKIKLNIVLGKFDLLILSVHLSLLLPSVLRNRKQCNNNVIKCGVNMMVILYNLLDVNTFDTIYGGIIYKKCIILRLRDNKY